ncbi:MAG: cobalamin-dependent protein [Nitrospirae bacterium]|nr:cobalamin-dependent protein [Nitrospirota bacterium]
MPIKKFALFHMGTDCMYGLEFVAAEILKSGHKIKWFDADFDGVLENVIQYKPDFICFSPLTTFFKSARELAHKIKKIIPGVSSVFGGAHVSALPEVVELEEIDIIVVGPVFGTIDNIINNRGSSGLVVKGNLIPIDQIMPAKREYYTDIPRIGSRHRKAIMSHFGCPYNCSFCSTSRVKKAYSPDEYKKFWLTRRPIKNLIEEASIFLEFPTKEVTLGDDDMLYGDQIESWLSEFSSAWKQKINLPIYGFVNPNTVVRASDKTIEILSGLVTTVAMGVQTSRPESLRLFNRQYQSESMIKNAIDRLKSYNIRVKIELIIGLPVADPIGDAIDTIKLGQRVAGGSFTATFPLMVYPGTILYDYCKNNNIALHGDDISYDLYSGIGAIKFDSCTQRRIKNLSKLGTFFIKYNIDEQWIRSLIDIELTDKASKSISESNYLESLIFRQGDHVKEEFSNLLEKDGIRY